MFEKILIANRGEIACRVIRTAKRGLPGGSVANMQIDHWRPHTQSS